MKIKTQISTLIIALTMMIAATTFASTTNFDFEDEAYINDIPFNTAMVVDQMNKINFNDETYIDDIPFNTAIVVAEYRYQNALTIEFNFDEELTVNDIPFNTSLVACNSNETYFTTIICSTK